MVHSILRFSLMVVLPVCLCTAAEYQNDTGSANGTQQPASTHTNVYWTRYSVGVSTTVRDIAVLLLPQAGQPSTTQTFTAGLWDDPNQDGNPGDAVLLATRTEQLVVNQQCIGDIRECDLARFDFPDTPVGLPGEWFFVSVSYTGNDVRIGVDNDHVPGSSRSFVSIDGGQPQQLNSLDYVLRANTTVTTNCCLGDLDEDGEVGFTDLISLLSSWGKCFCCAGDTNGDGSVGFDDLISFLSSWGHCE